MTQFKSLPGFREFYPEDKAVQNHIFDVWRRTSRRFGFREWDAPVLEDLELFTEKSGEEIVSQLFNFVDKGDRAVTLRPEMTPSLARMIAAKAGSMRRPIKWFAIGENFRYEKQQKGRLRSFVQYNADILGEPGPAADAEAIALCVESLRGFGLREGEFCIRLSDRNLWFRYLELFGVPSETVPAVLSVVDKLERDKPEDLLNNMRQALAGTTCDAGDVLAAVRVFVSCDSLPKIRKALFARLSLSWELLNQSSGAEIATPADAGFNSGGILTLDQAVDGMLKNWTELLGILDAMGLTPFVRIDLTIVRGLAYYTGFVFEAFQLVGQGRALAGGGRYDNLVKKLGGPDMPAVGFGMGDVVLRNLLEDLKLLPAYHDAPDFYAIILGEENRAEALKDVSELRRAGLVVEYAFKDGKFGKLIQTAEQSGARHALVYGGDELAAGVVKVRDMKERREIAVPRAHLVEALRLIAEHGLPCDQPKPGCDGKGGCGCGH